ncbi:hypothetical protein THUN1379_28240 [Paludibacterium sp. THUN1379]|nr:hypothetical protein THUN1379_28240 [Paludibacterium sp. THUN1379]
MSHGHQQVTATLLQLLFQHLQTVPDEVYPAIMPRQMLQDAPVEDKDTECPRMFYQRRIERGVILQAKVAAEPAKGGFGAHDGQISLF